MLGAIRKPQLISRNDFMFSKMININAGLKDGIINDMAVVNYRGLLGRTIDTSVSSTRVLLLTDPNSSIAVKTISNENHSLFLIDLNFTTDNKIRVLVDGDQGVTLKECVCIS